MNLFDLRPYRIENFQDVYHYCLKFSTHFLFRWDFSMDDYLRDELRYSRSDLIETMLCCIRAWASITLILVLLLWPDCEWILTKEIIAKIVPLEGYELLYFYALVMLLYIEVTWLTKFVSIHRRTLQSPAFIEKLFNDHLYCRSDRKRLLRKFVYGGYLSGSIYRSFALYSILWSTYVLFKIIHQYQSGEIKKLYRIVNSVIIGGLTVVHFIFVAGLCFTVLFCFAFTCYLLVFKFCQLKDELCVKVSEFFASNTYHIVTDDIEFYHQKFRSKYSEIFNQISSFNSDYRIFFLMTEMSSQLTTIVLVLFYSEQDRMTIYSYAVIGTLASIFLLTTVIYWKISYFDSYNLIIFNMMSSWSARLWSRISQQNLTGSIRIFKRKYRLFDRMPTTKSMKIHHFNQSIPSNQIGFTCGTLFYIDKSCYADLLLTNISFIMLFYKIVILNIAPIS